MWIKIATEYKVNRRRQRAVHLVLSSMVSSTDESWEEDVLYYPPHHHSDTKTARPSLVIIVSLWKSKIFVLVSNCCHLMPDKTVVTLHCSLFFFTWIQRSFVRNNKKGFLSSNKDTQNGKQVYGKGWKKLQKEKELKNIKRWLSVLTKTV